jgi:Trehalase
VNTKSASAILRANDRGGYTIPTDRLYPFQWNWDSGFVAMGWATFDAARGFREIERLLEGQWEDGLVPQIVFHAPSDDYFPGPDVWGTRRTPPTSAITQPPILATAVRRMWAGARHRAAAEAHVATLYPRLLASHRWWRRARDPGETGLVATLHPWETGMDNSPAWDAALARVPTETVTPVVRRDTMHVAASMRPRMDEYLRFIHLVDLFRDVGWEPARMVAASPFRVVDVGTNAILMRAERDLLTLAGRFGTGAQAGEIAERLAQMERAIDRLWSEVDGVYRSFDMIGHSPIAAATSGGLLPLFGGGIPAARVAAMSATLRRWGQGVRHPVPSTDPADPRFEPRRYWRGPVWAVVNWMLAEGLSEAGERSLAADLRGATAALIRDGGFCEYFDPLTGEGIGGGTFSWTAAIALLVEAAGRT